MSRATRGDKDQTTARSRPGHAGGEKSAGRTTTLSPAGSKIVAAFEEAVDAIRSGGPAAAKLTARTYRADFAAAPYGPDDVNRVRGLLGMSQAVFARFLGVDANTVRSWEQGARTPSAIARRFMGEIESDPAYWRRRVGQALAAANAEGSTQE